MQSLQCHCQWVMGKHVILTVYLSRIFNRRGQVFDLATLAHLIFIPYSYIINHFDIHWINPQMKLARRNWAEAKTSHQRSRVTQTCLCLRCGMDGARRSLSTGPWGENPAASLSSYWTEMLSADWAPWAKGNSVASRCSQSLGQTQKWVSWPLQTWRAWMNACVHACVLVCVWSRFPMNM